MYKVDADMEGEVIEDVSFATKGTSSLLIASKKPDREVSLYRSSEKLF